MLNYAATHQGYLVTDASTDPALKNDWYRDCKRAKIPWIVVTKKRKFANVDCDLFTMANELDEVIRTKQAELTAGYRELHHTYGTRKSSCGPAPSGPYFSGIPIELAEDLAKDLLYFVTCVVMLG